VRDPPWNSSIKASSLVIVGAPAQSAQPFRGIFHAVHTSLMSQESQKFLRRAIPPVFYALWFVKTLDTFGSFEISDLEKLKTSAKDGVTMLQAAAGTFDGWNSCGSQDLLNYYY
jgi:hypothetical protein